VTLERRWRRSLQRFELREPFAVAEAATAAPVMLAYPSRVGTDSLFSRTVVPHPVRRSSSSLDFAAPPSTFSRCRVGPRGLPVPDPPGYLQMKYRARPPWAWRHLRRAMLSPWISLLIRLSWVSPALLPASGQLSSASTPGRCCHLPSVRRLHPLRIVFRPRGLSPPRRLAPLWRFGHIAARSGQGSLRFATPPSCRLLRGPEGPRSNRSSSCTPFPASAVRTLRSIPLVSSRSASLRFVALLPLSSATSDWFVPRCEPPEVVRDADLR
jgi:hypothetical protein